VQIDAEDEDGRQSYDEYASAFQSRHGYRVLSSRYVRN
jgi:hypothetical protein